MGGVVFLILAVLVIVTIAMGVRIVPQGSEWLVQRLGRFHTVLKPGLNIIIPYIDIARTRLRRVKFHYRLSPRRQSAKTRLFWL